MKNYFEQKQREYSERLDKKTMEYQRKYGFELNPLEGHKTWNVEADAFKHAFMGADLVFDYGNSGSFILGVLHELQTPKNPQDEWNMDSWNNAKGRGIAKEILKEYGDKIYKMSDKQRSDIIADKVMQKMKKGELIVKPSDARVYEGKFENAVNEIKKRRDNASGGAASLEPFSRQQIGAMSPEEFRKNESLINEQLAKGVILDESGAYKDIKIEYTREDIAKMSSKEYAKHESSILRQANSVGIPSKNQLPKGKKSGYSEKQSSSNESGDGKWVTINGNHVLIKD